MLDTITLRMAQRGVLTLPKALCQNHSLQPGDTFTLLDLRDVLVLSPRRSEMDSIAEPITAALREQGEMLETTQVLHEER